jgi:general secretion pathway protein I
VNGRRAGFTLVEVLVALAVLAISLASIGSLMFANIRAAGALEQHVSLTETARALWTALPGRGASAPDMSGETAGQRWRITTQAFVDSYVDKSSPSPFEPKLVIMRVQSPSGAMLQIDTVRLQRRADR